MINYLGCVGLGEVTDDFITTGGSDIEGEKLSKVQRLGEIGNRWAAGEMVPVTQLIGLEPVTYDYISELTGNRVLRTYGDLQIQYAYIHASTGSNVVMPDLWYCGQFRYTELSWVVARPRIESNVGTVVVNNVSNNGIKLTGAVTSGQLYGYNVVQGAVVSAGRVSNSFTGMYGSASYIDMSYGSDNFLNVAYPYYEYNGFEGEPVITVTGAMEDNNGFGSDDYPEDYVGTDTIGPDTKWPELFSDIENPNPTPEPRPENPYNPIVPDAPEVESGTPEWKDETTKNIMPLAGIRFDKLFPFSMVASIPVLTEKINVLQPDGGVYRTVVLPIPKGDGEDSDLVLDLKPLHDLLLMVRPLVKVLLVFFLVFSLVMFWKSILTGD